MLNIKTVNVKDIKMYSKNPRKNKKAIEFVKNSIKQFGYKVPIVIDKNNVIVCGHTRYEALKQLGEEQINCVIADDLTEEQVKKFRLADNKTQEIAEWDEALLSLEMLDLNCDLSEFGFEKKIKIQGDSQKEKNIYLDEMEIRPLEHHDYIMFVFDNSNDFLNVCNRFGIKKIFSQFGEKKIVGVGRIVRGSRLVEELGNTNGDIKQG